MDSGNSGSFQSSSGGAGAGDEEYDSRPESMSSFFNPNPNPNHQLHHHQPPQPLTNSTFFNPDPNPLYNLDSIWSRDLRSDPNFADFAPTHTQTQTQTQTIFNPAQYSNPSPVESNVNPGRGPDHLLTTKNPKKRTRASRRAPTTVLTTDTTNFRQMVQEFTGIPAAPFSAASSPFSRRFDLFSGAGAGPMYPLRPSAQKVQLQQPTFLNSGTSNNITTATTATVEASSNNFQLPPSDIHGFSKQPQNLLNLQNPMFSFQSLLQSTLPLGTAKSDNQQSQLLSGFPSSSTSVTRWRDQDESLRNYEGGNGNTQNVGGYKLNSSDFHNNHEKALETTGDQAQGNVDSWVCPSD